MVKPPQIQRKALQTMSEGESDNADRLSSLSECVLLHILSCYETKQAATTSILSTRWRHLFLSLPEIDLSFCPNQDASDSDRHRLFNLFLPFANRLLQQRNKAQIKKIQFSVQHFVESFRPGVESLLMSTAAAVSNHKVEDLYVSVEMCDTTEPCSFTVPSGIFSSETLVCLHLSFQIGWNCDVPEIVSLPNLKTLRLIAFRLAAADSVQRILQGCPSLENLVLIPRIFEGLQVEALLVSSPSLNFLVFYWDENVQANFNVIVKTENLENFTCHLEGRHKVTLDAPNLKILSIRGHVVEVHLTQSLASINEAVVEAYFLLHVPDVEGLFIQAHFALKFFSALQHVKSLSLSENLMMALHFTSGVIPTFRNLIKLELLPDYCSYLNRSWFLEVLLDLFESSPNLEVLIFNEVFDNYLSDVEEFDSVFPLAFVEHLKVVEMTSFKGRELEFKLVEFFLENGKSLEKIAIQRQDLKYVVKDGDRILSFKQCSKNCQIELKSK